MSETHAKFVSGDGVPHEVAVDSPAFELMSKNGSFRRVDSFETETSGESTQAGETGTADESGPTDAGPAADQPEAETEQAKADLKRLNKAQLVAEAERIGVTVVPDEMTKAQIIELIEAAEAKS